MIYEFQGVGFGRDLNSQALVFEQANIWIEGLWRGLLGQN